MKSALCYLLAGFKCIPTKLPPNFSVLSVFKEVMWGPAMPLSLPIKLLEASVDAILLGQAVKTGKNKTTDFVLLFPPIFPMKVS